MTNDYDAEYEHEQLINGGGGLRWMSMLVMILVVFGFFSLVWYAYNNSVGEQKEDTIPVIAAANPTYKTKPHNAGGLDVNHKDIEAYQLMRREPSVTEEAQKVERLMPQADKPIVIETVDPEEVMEKISENVPELDDIEQAEADMTAPVPKVPAMNEAAKLEVLINEASKPIQKVTENVVESTTQDVEKITAIVARPDVVEVVKTPVTQAPKPAPKVVAPKKSGAYVQLAALRSKAEAGRLWNKLSAKHKDVLGGLSYYTQAVNVKGSTLYRLRVSGIGSHAKAASICRTLKARSQGCLASK